MRPLALVLRAGAVVLLAGFVVSLLVDGAPRPVSAKATAAATTKSAKASNETSKARVASPFQSDRSGTSTPSVSAQARCDHAESRDMPNGLIPAASRSSPLSRRRYSSFVQVGDQSCT